MTGAAVVVGYGPGVGAAVAAAFGREGRPLAIVARNGGALETAAGEFVAAGFDASAFPADAADPASLEAALRGAREAFGDPEALIYNAARWRPGPLLDLDPASLETDLRLSVGGAFLCARTVAPAMIAAGRGTILFTGGGLALHPSAEAPTLSIGKAGLRALALVLAQELAPAGVRVGTVTIAGVVAEGTSFAPARIADAFLALHCSPHDPATAEIVFRG